MDSFKKLIEIMNKLRLECPWDRKQTFESLRNLTIEETYELADAIIDKKWDDVKNELGDLLLHIVFYAKIGSEKKLFDINDIIDHVSKKIVDRHPHVFGDKKFSTSDEVIKSWELIKLNNSKGVLKGIPNKLPALIKAYRIQQKVSGVGFDWKNKDGILEKIDEEIYELKDEIVKKDKNLTELEFGDFLFSVVNYARFLDIDPELALEKSNKKFTIRFEKMENLIRKKGLVLSEMNLTDLNLLWEEVKSI
ncbi:MAG: nucleoside triphosphate pyrophosphohydrolase [Flavobacteriaceae bacterium]|nr:nucleoside triphosphate pyrophosphohydrolase [Flavobacteriaceae bacterium]|tara:strand:+ start:7416 stop:8165 length:750 start_codon:yes stop_codon:yes gene_type:complete